MSAEAVVKEAIARVTAVLKSIQNIPSRKMNALIVILESLADGGAEMTLRERAAHLGSVSTTISQEETRLHEVLQAASDAVQQAEAEFAVTVAQRGAAESAVAEAKKEERVRARRAGKSAKLVALDAVKAVKNAEVSLKTEQEEYARLVKATAARREAVEAEWTVYNDHFLPLKEAKEGKDFKEAKKRETSARGAAQRRGGGGVSSAAAATMAKHVSAVITVLHDAKVSSALLIGAPEALKKTPEERRDFDNLVWNSVETTFQSRKAQASEEMAHCAEKEHAAAARIREHEAALDAARSMQLAVVDAVLAAKNALQAAEDAAVEAEGRVKAAKAKLEASEGALEHFQEEIRGFKFLTHTGAPAIAEAVEDADQPAGDQAALSALCGTEGAEGPDGDEGAELELALAFNEEDNAWINEAIRDGLISAPKEEAKSKGGGQKKAGGGKPPKAKAKTVAKRLTKRKAMKRLTGAKAKATKSMKRR